MLNARRNPLTTPVWLRHQPCDDGANVVAPRRCSNRPVSAIHHHDRAADIGRHNRCQEDRRPDDVLGLPAAAGVVVEDCEIRLLARTFSFSGVSNQGRSR